MSESAATDPDALDALPSGSAIGGYAVRRTLGHGGFGITYEAHNRVTGKEVAIKEFFPSSMARRDGSSRLIYSKVNAETIGWALRKFEETTTTLCGLSHANIVQVHDYVPANGTGYMIMELLDGQTLEDWLKARPQPPSLDVLRPIVDPVMDALSYVHDLGLIHRDIAPDNILITRNGRPVLIDFGSVSRDLSDAKRQAMSSTVGLSKRHYTAPEQMLSKARPTPEADIYSMGAVLYRALSGEKPTDGQDRIDAVFRNQPDSYEPMKGRKLAGCPSPVAEAIDKALAVRPEARLHKMADLKAALAPPASVTSKPFRRSRWLAATAVVAVLAGLGGGVVGASLSRSQPPADVDLVRMREKIRAERSDLERRQNEFVAANEELDNERKTLAGEKDAIEAQRGTLEKAQSDLDRERRAMEDRIAALEKGGKPNVPNQKPVDEAAPEPYSAPTPDEALGSQPDQESNVVAKATDAPTPTPPAITPPCSDECRSSNFDRILDLITDSTDQFHCSGFSLDDAEIGDIMGGIVRNTGASKSDYDDFSHERLVSFGMQGFVRLGPQFLSIQADAAHIRTVVRTMRSQTSSFSRLECSP